MNNRLYFKSTIKWQFDELFGSKLIPNQKGVFVGHTNEYKIPIVVNGEGFVDKDHQINNEDNAYRILIIGDSFAENFQVPYEKSYAYLLNRWLNQRYDFPIEIITLGIGNSGTVSHYLALKNIGAKYKPNLVIHIFYTGNDIFNNSKELQKVNTIPYANFDNEKLTIQPPINTQQGLIKELKNILKNKSMIVWLILNAKGEMLNRKDLHLTDYPLEYDIYNHNYSEAFINAWQITLKLILEIKKETKLMNANYLFVSTANNEQINIEIWDKIKKTYPLLSDKKMDLEKPDKILASYCEENKINCLFLFNNFLNYKLNNPKILTHYPKDGHWNEIGSKIVADSLEKEIEKLFIQTNF